ncbi:MAG: hypothetical protein K8R54_17710 [Bacteroidales bacterium]|nr:hypothetical protein [Bacteroidales bacterium]
MIDTPDEIYKIQHDIFMKKPLKERFLLNLELTEFEREKTKRRNNKNNSTILKIIKISVNQRQKPISLNYYITNSLKT